MALEEGQKIAKQDQFYRQQQKEAEAKRWANAIALRKQLNEMKEESQRLKAIEKVKETEHEERIQAWVSRKSKQNQLKKQIENRLFRFLLN